MKTARRSFGDDYVCQKPWDEDMFVQCGGSGVVLDRKDPEKSYTTAFFEAFPKKPDCFLRGEGSTVEEAEAACWEKYQKVITCEHEMERRNRRDGYGYCKHCSYSSMVFEPLDKCCKCGVPTRYTTDYKGKFYCEKHGRNKPKNPNPTRMERMMEMGDRRLPRKEKKLLKKAASYRFKQNGIAGKMTYSYSLSPQFKIGHHRIDLLFRKQRTQLIEIYRQKT
jgi:hypothetical protein